MPRCRGPSDFRCCQTVSLFVAEICLRSRPATCHQPAMHESRASHTSPASQPGHAAALSSLVLRSGQHQARPAGCLRFQDTKNVEGQQPLLPPHLQAPSPHPPSSLDRSPLSLAQGLQREIYTIDLVSLRDNLIPHLHL